MATNIVDSADDEEGQARVSCSCSNTCMTKTGSRRQGCPCRTEGKSCSASCTCGTRTKPCKNKAESTDQQAAAPNLPQANEEQLMSEEEEATLENRRVAVRV